MLFLRNYFFLILYYSFLKASIGFNLAALSPFDLQVAYGIAGVGAIIVLLVIFSLGHKVVDKKRANRSA